MSPYEWLGLIANLIGILTFIVSIVIWYIVRREREAILQLSFRSTPSGDNLKALSMENKNIKSRQPVALCLCLLDSVESIKPPVSEFLTANALDMPIEELNLNGINNLEDIAEFNRQLIALKRKITAENRTEVHLFIGGPVFMGVLTGSVLNNWIPVKVYHKTRIDYEYQYLLP